MKKNLFLVALSGLALASCSSVDDVPEVNVNNAIGFESVVGKNSKAVTGDLTLSNFDLFSVFGYYTKDGETRPVKIFDDQLVSKQSDGSWTYSPERFWNPDKSTYYFYAYSCADVQLDETGKFGKPLLDLSQTTIADRALEIQNYLCDETHQHDLIVAKNEGMEGMEKTAEATIKRSVAFKFEHALSKINAVFTSSFPVGYDIEVSDVKIVNFYDKADFDFDPMNWKNRSQSEPNKSIELAITKGQNTTSANDDPEKTTYVTTGSVFVLPMIYNKDDDNNKTAYVELQFTITVKQNDVVYLTRQLKGVWQPQWNKGWSYTYYVDLGGNQAQLEPIAFESVQDMADPDSWGASQRVDMTFSLNQ